MWQKSTIGAQNEIISDNSNRLIQLQTDIVAQNATIQSSGNQIDQLEMQIIEIQDNILLQETSIMQAEATQWSTILQFKCRN